MQEILLETGCGTVKGTEREEDILFRGISYATAERFSYPVPVLHWNGIYDATGKEKNCPQYDTFREEARDADNFYYEEFRKGDTFLYEENALQLNIQIPKNKKKCPVLVFIHGGGHENGTLEEMPYGDGLAYTRRGLVYVSVGYRLNVFSLYESENYGLYDQIEAIRWIHKNIEAFGGDAERIVLMGQSAGAMSIMDLLYSQLLKGIISGAIMLSGAGCVPKIVRPYTRQEAAGFWEAVRKQAGAETEEEFKSLPARDIWEAWFTVSRREQNFHYLQPGIDGRIIPDVPQTVLKKGMDLDVPVMLGVTSQDFMPYLIFEMAYGYAKRNSRKHRAPVYGYLFDRELPGNRYKAYHAADLWYWFGNRERCWRPFEEVDTRLSGQMMDYVANFVKNHGNPNGDKLPEWKPVSGKQRGFRLLDGVSEGYASPEMCRRKLWHTFLRDKGPM